jgi:hypothetical protein
LDCFTASENFPNNKLGCIRPNADSNSIKDFFASVSTKDGGIEFPFNYDAVMYIPNICPLIPKAEEKSC